MSTAAPIRVLIADDQAMIRHALAALLQLEPDFDVVGQAATTSAAVELATKRQPDVVLMDVRMPTGDGGPRDGIAAAPAVLAGSPRTRVIILTTFGRPGYLKRAMEAGAVGYLVKDAPADQLVDAIRRVHRGLRFFDPALAADSLALGTSLLTEREAQVLLAAAGGGSTSAIARQLFLSEGTVRNHLSAAIGKLSAANRAEAVRVATEFGWL